MPAKVSLVIAAYNAGEYIARALTSVAKQTRPPDEVIVIDDGSKDDTAEQVKSFKRQSSLKVVLQRQANRGLAATRNVGVRSAQGDLVAFLDADDVIYPEFLEQAVGGMEAHPEWAVCFSDRDVVNADGQLIARDLDHPGFQSIEKRHVGNDLWELSDPDLFCKMVVGNLIPMTILFRRAEIGATGYFDEDLRYGEDRLFLLRLIKRKGVFGYVNRPLGTWQRHENNLTSPSNSLKNCFYSDRILARLVENRERWHLASRELECVFAAQRSLAESWVYCASSAGSRTTLPLASRLLYERRIGFYCFAKALARYLVSPLRFSLDKHP